MNNDGANVDAVYGEFYPAYTATRRYFDKLHQEVNSWIEGAKLTA